MVCSFAGRFLNIACKLTNKCLHNPKTSYIVDIINPLCYPGHQSFTEVSHERSQNQIPPKGGTDQPQAGASRTFPVPRT